MRVNWAFPRTSKEIQHQQHSLNKLSIIRAAFDIDSNLRLMNENRLQINDQKTMVAFRISRFLFCPALS